MRKFRGNPWAALLVVSLGFFMTLLDLTIVNIAIPNMIAKLHAGLADILWVINGYAIVLAVLLITAGRLGDLRGPRNVYVAGVALFTVASAACGLSVSAGQLIAFRVLQGLGAALLIPQTLTILTTVFPPERRGAAFGIWGAVAGVATIAGPTLGGLLVTAFDWRWIFFVNLPIGLAVLPLTFALIPDVRPGRRHRLDLAGVVLAGAALLAICYGLVEGQRYNWGKIASFLSIPLVLGIGVVLLAAFVVVQKLMQDREPLVPFALLRDRNFTLMNIVSGTLAVGTLGIFLPFTIYLQSVLGDSALRAGLTLAPASLVSMFLAPLAGRLADRVGGKYILFTGLTLFAVGMGLAVSAARVNSPWYDFLPGLLVAGVGMGCTFAPLGTVAMRNVQPRLAGAASGLFNTNRQVGAVIGSAAIGALLQNRLATSLASQATLRSAALPAAVRGRFVAGFAGAARTGLQGGAGQPGGGQGGGRGTGLPAATQASIARIAHEAFTYGFVNALRPTIALPIALIVLAALGCLAIKRDQPAPPGPDRWAAAAEAAAEPVGATAAASGQGGRPPGTHRSAEPAPGQDGAGPGGPPPATRHDAQARADPDGTAPRKPATTHHSAEAAPGQDGAGPRSRARLGDTPLVATEPPGPDRVPTPSSARPLPARRQPR